MDLIEKLLTEINEGKTSFEPRSDSESDMQDFQSIAKALIYSDKKGLIEEIEKHKESQTGNNWYDRIWVYNGLSFEGGEYIKNRNTKKDIESNNENIFKVSPVFMGIGMDLIAAYRWWKNKKH